MVQTKNLMVQFALLLIIVSILSASASDVDNQWLTWLDNPPSGAIAEADQLADRADAIVKALLHNTSTIAVPADVDVVVSGGSNYDAYYMGASQIFSRVQAAGWINQHRFAGASAGGMMPFELLLKGENSTLTMHLAYGLLQEKFPGVFWNDLSDASEQDHHWRLMADWMTKKYESSLSSLDGRVFLALSCLDPLPKLVVVSNFTSQDQTEHAFMATGTFVETYNGMLCSDGGAESGAKMTPLFQDGARAQIIVDLMETGASTEAAFHYTMAQYSELIKQGQDEAAIFLQTGKTRADAITLCPKGSDTKSNVCK